MATLEERVAVLETHFEQFARGLQEIRDAIGSLEERIDRRFEAIDRWFEGVDQRFETIDRRLEAHDRRFDRLDQKISRYFLWMAGAQVTTLAAIVVALLAR